MLKIKIIPSGFPCTLAQCPPGLFVFGEVVGLKTEYTNDKGDLEAFVADSGETFWGGARNRSERLSLVVVPAIYRTEDVA